MTLSTFYLLNYLSLHHTLYHIPGLNSADISLISFYDGKLNGEPPSQKLGLGRLRKEEHTVFFSKRRKNSLLCAQPTPSQWGIELVDVLIYRSWSHFAFLCGMHTTTSITALLRYSPLNDCIIFFDAKLWSFLMFHYSTIVLVFIMLLFTSFVCPKWSLQALVSTFKCKYRWVCVKVCAKESSKSIVCCRLSSKYILSIISTTFPMTLYYLRN